MFCPNCGTQLGSGVNFCPNCGTKVATVVATQAVEKDNMVMLVSLGTCARTTAAALLSHVCGYASDDALLIVDNVPITVARGLTDAQARYLAQAFTEYGLEVSIYDGEGGIVEAKGSQWGITHDRSATCKSIVAIRRFT